MATTTEAPRTIDLPVAGMDCAECAQHVEAAVRQLPGVKEARVLLSAERATVTDDPAVVDRAAMAAAVAGAGYRVPEEAAGEGEPTRPDVGNAVGWGVLGVVAAVVLGAAAGERLGLFDAAVERVPWWVPALAIAV